MPGIASPFAASWGQANYGATFSAANTTRYDNSIQYKTPSFAGFQFGLGYSFNIDGAQRGTTKINGEKTKTIQRLGLLLFATRMAPSPLVPAMTSTQTALV